MGYNWLSQLVFNGLIAGGIYALMALGFTIIYRTVKFFHFAHGAVYTAGAYLAFSLSLLPHFPFLLAFFLSVGFSALLGIAIDRMAYYPLRKRNAPLLVYLLVSFGVFVTFQNLIQLIFGAQTLTLKIGNLENAHNILGAVITDSQLLIISASIFLFSISWLFMQKTKLGKALRAVSDDYIGAMVVGINPEKAIILAFAIGSALAGAAGILISFEVDIEPTIGFYAILKGIVATIVGGIGSIPGALFGGFFLGLAENFGVWKISTSWKDTIAFAILILVLLIRPSGIMGIKKKEEHL